MRKLNRLMSRRNLLRIIFLGAPAILVGCGEMSAQGEEADTGQYSVDEKDQHSTTESAQQGKAGLRRLSAAGTGQIPAPQMNSAEKRSEDNACPA